MNKEELNKLIISFQKRHLLAHCDGIMDEKYLEKTNDDTYEAGQIVGVNKEDVYELIDIIEKIASGIKKFESVSYDKIYLNKLDDFIENINHKSLIRRTEFLFSICQPSEDFEIKSGFSFNQDKLKKIDNLRHDIVHDTGILSPSINNVENKIDYLLNTGLHLWGMVNEKYDVKVNLLFEE